MVSQIIHLDCTVLLYMCYLFSGVLFEILNFSLIDAHVYIIILYSIRILILILVQKAQKLMQCENSYFILYKTPIMGSTAIHITAKQQAYTQQRQGAVQPVFRVTSLKDREP